MSKPARILIIIGLLSLTEIASAFYDSNLGRWLNRDPLGEEGFEQLHRWDPDPVGDGPNVYLFVYNNPISSYDPFGLLPDDLDFPVPKEVFRFVLFGPRGNLCYLHQCMVNIPASSTFIVGIRGSVVAVCPGPVPK